MTWRHPGRLARLAAVALGVVSYGLPTLQAQGSKPTEYQVKAVYLYNFGKFIGWPTKAAQSKGESFAVCVLGQDPFGSALDAVLRGETIGGAPIVARRIPKPQDAMSCRVLFISTSEENQLEEVLAALDKTSVLTVSDIVQFAKRGGMVRFFLDGNKVRFEVNLPAAQRVGLNLSSELLKLAVAVRRAP